MVQVQPMLRSQMAHLHQRQDPVVGLGLVVPAAIDPQCAGRSMGMDVTLFIVVNAIDPQRASRLEQAESAIRRAGLAHGIDEEGLRLGAAFLMRVLGSAAT